MRYLGFFFIGVMFFSLLVSLVLTIVYFEDSPLYYLSNVNNSFNLLENNMTVLNSEINTWAIRGQIGDILAGHFSALAFVGIAYSIYLQNSSNKQQREEFFISNINVKLDRFYKIFDKNLEGVENNYCDLYLQSKERFNSLSIQPSNSNTVPFNKRKEVKKAEEKNLKDAKNNKKNYENKIKNIILILNLIYDEIEILKGSYDSSYQRYRQELKLRLDLHKIFVEIKKSFDGADECLAFNLLNEEIK